MTLIILSMSTILGVVALDKSVHRFTTKGGKDARD